MEIRQCMGRWGGEWLVKVQGRWQLRAKMHAALNPELPHWKRPWCWERLRAGEGDDRGWDGWMASPTRWTWVWVDSRSWWWIGRPGVLQFMGLQGVRHDWATELNWTESVNNWKSIMFYPIIYLINFLFWKNFNTINKVNPFYIIWKCKNPSNLIKYSIYVNVRNWYTEKFS